MNISPGSGSRPCRSRRRLNARAVGEEGKIVKPGTEAVSSALPGMSFKDHFSVQADAYAKFRPRYPAVMFEYLGSIAPSKRLAWDCATGNGQAAVELAKVFERVIATDASEKQIAQANARENIEYRVASAEASGLAADSIDVIMVAQALHWFDLERFHSEVQRVLKPRGIFAASAYRFFRITPAIDELVSHRYYDEIVGPYWPPERTSIEKFEEIPFPFTEAAAPGFEMIAEWKMADLVGYLRTWSSTQRYMAARGRDPLDQIASSLAAAWGDPDQARRVVWPLTLRVAIKP